MPKRLPVSAWRAAHPVPDRRSYLGLFPGTVLSTFSLSIGKRIMPATCETRT